MQLRKGGAAGGVEAERAAARQAAAAMRSSGTVLVGDISNTLITPPALAAERLGGVVFHELIGFQPKDPRTAVQLGWQRAEQARTDLPADNGPPIEFSIVAHAPYSVSPSLFTEIVRAARRAPLSIHLAESAEEIEFLRTGRGPIRDMIEALGVWTDTWQTPRCEPDEYVNHFDYLRPGTLVVHGVQFTAAALERLRSADVVIVTCPRSNEWVGAGIPPVAHFFASGIPVAIGTDSLASVSTLNLFDELAALRRIAPEVSAASLLDSATRIGATALGYGADYGTIAVGKRAALIAVRVPATVTDVEEYLVSGVTPADIQTLDAL
jgi:cytosine/adenosine deaminase-related metal-dependent hydrolase